ncbi:MAG: hypothetical protein IJE21_03455 [Alistipes sp.]|nr:hypothetical protein [Alistipes sp.]
MRKIFSFLMSVAVAATTFVGCTNTEINIDSTPTPTPTGTYRQLTFSTEQDASRTHHNGETIIWSKGDKIRIGYTKDGVWQNAEGRTGAQDDTSTAKLYASNELGSDSEYSKFTLTTLFKDTDATGEIIFYGLYPSNVTKRNEPDFADSAEGTINVVLPQIQSPAATSFDSNADLMVSQSVKTYEALPTYEEHISMRWTRLVTHGMITLKNLTAAGITADEKVQYVIIEADADDALTGEFTLDIDGQTLTPIEGKSKNKVRLSYADTDYNTLTDADEDGAADDFVVWFATAPFEATSLTITVGTDKATYTREITSANKTFVVNKRNKLGINMASATPVEIETEDNWMMVQDKTKFVDGITVIIANMYSGSSEPAMNIEGETTDISVSKEADGSGYIYPAAVGNDIQQFKLGVNPEVSGQYSFQALNGDNAGEYLWASTTTNNGTLTFVQEEKFWTVDTTEFQIGKSTQLGEGGVVPAGGTASLAYYNSVFCVRNNVVSGGAVAFYYNATALPSLSAPVIDSAEQAAEGNAVQVVWGEVENAVSYTITATCEGKEDIVVKNITDTTYTVDGFVEGTWTITVTAAADNYKSATSAGVQVEVIDQTPRITVTPTELAFTSAGGTKSITVETAYFGANVEISAESDNNAFSVLVDGTTVSVTAEANVTDAAIEGTITVTATDGATTLTADVAVQQAAKSNATAEWQLLTDLRSLQTEGLEVVIAAADYDVAMCTTQSDDNRKSAAITKSGNTMSIVGDVQIFQLQQGTTEDSWAFFDDTLNGYLYAAGTGSNLLKTKTELNEQGSWTLWFDSNGTLSVVANAVTDANGNDYRNVMQYNANKGSELFSCYASASQKAVAIYYRLASTEPRINSVSTENDATEFEHDGSTTINATVATKYAAGETLSVTFDGDWVTIDPTTVTVGGDNTATFALTAAENTANESRTITMTVSLLNGSSKQLTFTQKAAPTETDNEWTLLDDASKLKAGMEVIIAASDSNVAISTTQNSNNRGQATITKSGNTLSSIGADVQIFQLQQGTTSGTWAFFDDAYPGYLYAASSGSNYLRTQAVNDVNGSWTITVTNNVASIVATNSTNRNVMQYNSSSSLFSCYGSASQKALAIYYRGEGSGELPITPSLTVTPTSLTWEADATEAQQITVTANGDWSHSESGMDWATVSVSGNVITVTPKAANSNEAANEGTITISMAGVDDVVVNCSQAGATQSGGGEGGGEVAGATDYIDREFTGVTNGTTTYSEWSGKTGASGAVYAGQSAGGNDAVQLRSNNNNSGIIVTKSAGKVSKVIVTWNSNTADGRTLNIYGKNSAYSAATDLYDTNKQGELLGTIVKGTSTELTIEGDYAFIGLRSKSSAMYLTQIQIVWGDGGEGGGETPVTPTQLTMSTVSCTAQTENSLTFSWSEVANATGYQVSIDGGTSYSATQTETTYTWIGLSASTTKTLYVKAIGDGTNYTDSTAVSAQGTTSAASGGGEVSETVEMTTFSATSASMDSNISYSTAKGGGTSNPGVYSGVIRLYQNSNGTGGGTITITAANGATLSSVSIGSSMNTSVAYTIESSTTKSTTASLAANGKYTVNDINATSITFYCMGTTSSARLYVNYLSVTYTK